MKLKEFKERIDEADKLLRGAEISDRFICNALDESFPGKPSECSGHFYCSKIKVVFWQLFKPRNMKKSEPYFDDVVTEENLHTRQIALRLFEQHCIQHKLYLEF